MITLTTVSKRRRFFSFFLFLCCSIFSIAVSAQDDCNLLTNGDFELGNTGFSSGLPYECECAIGSICVASVPTDKCANTQWFSDVFDNTFGDATGHFLVVDGTEYLGTPTTVWGSNPVSVIVGAEYEFSFFVYPKVSTPSNIARLNVLLNGVQIGPTVNLANLTLGQWNEVTRTFIATTSTISLALFEENTASSGHDYGLDDMNLCGGCDEVIVGNDVRRCTDNAGDEVIPISVNAGTNTGTWQILGNGTIADPNAQSTTVTGLDAGITTLVWVDDCLNQSFGLDVVLTPNPNVGLSAADLTLCEGETTVAFAFTDVSVNNYIWADENGILTVSPSNNYFIDGDFEGILIVRIIDAISGCRAADTLTIIREDCIPLCTDVNLITNGDFALGATGFSTDLTEACDCSQSSFCIAAQATDKCDNPNWVEGLWDHTLGTANGEYMIVDGGNPGTVVWKSPPIVTEIGESLEFSFWVLPNVSSISIESSLIVRMNGEQQGGVIDLSTLTPVDTWHQIVQTIVADDIETSVEIVQETGSALGHNFGIDDIFLASCCGPYEGLPTIAETCDDELPLCFPIQEDYELTEVFWQDVQIIINDPTEFCANQPGIYYLTLSGNDGACEVMDTIRILTQDCSCTAAAAFTAELPFPDLLCSYTQFTNTSTSNNNTDIIGYSWNFGDGNSSDEENPFHFYQNDGVYTVTLTVTGLDEQGDCCTSTVSQDLFVNCACEIDPAFTFNAEKCEVTFTQNSTSGSFTQITAYQWNMGDGTILWEENPVYEFPASGTYDVTLTVFGMDGDETCQESITQSVTLDCGEPQNCIIDADFTYQNIVSNFWVFLNQSTAGWDIDGFFWEVDDGQTSTDENPAFLLPPGTYEVCLTVVSGNGTGCCTDQYCETIVIAQPMEAPDQMPDRTKVDDRLKEDINVFPNPSNGIFELVSKTGVQSTGLLVVTDYLGKQVLVEPLQNNHQQLDLSDFPAGVYHLQIQIGEQTFSKNLIKTD